MSADHQTNVKQVLASRDQHYCLALQKWKINRTRPLRKRNKLTSGDERISGGILKDNQCISNF